jgi:hypothetical protein
VIAVVIAGFGRNARTPTEVDPAAKVPDYLLRESRQVKGT